MPNRSIRASAEQIEHIKQHHGAFVEATGFQDVETYFRAYGEHTDLYERLCTSLNIKPITSTTEK